MEDIYINGNNKVSIEYDNEIVSNVYIDGKEIQKINLTQIIKIIKEQKAKN